VWIVHGVCVLFLWSSFFWGSQLTMHNSILSCYVCIMVVGPNWQLSCREGGGARGMELPPWKETGSSKWVPAGFQQKKEIGFGLHGRMNAPTTSPPIHHHHLQYKEKLDDLHITWIFDWKSWISLLLAGAIYNSQLSSPTTDWCNVGFYLVLILA
jgi:hypothetical protein